MFKNKTRRVVAGIIAVGALVAGCGGSGDAGAENTPADTATANQADITFAHEMIPHHQQAVEMAALAATRADSPEVRELAAQIEGAQDPEIETMTGWLKQWGAPSGTMDHGDMDGDMAGMMSDEDMATLEQATGAEFDRLFMEMMIKHHEGAIEMAKTALRDGQNADAATLAKDIIDAQQAEIDTMRELLRTS